MTDCPNPLSDCRDPGSLGHAERQAMAAAGRAQQKVWLPRLNALVEPPTLTETFPAFLLETPAFAGLRAAIGAARHRHDLDTATADELEHFADRYRTWLLQTEEEITRQQQDLMVR
ncbi:MAG: hypothetical protein ACYS5W_14720 [Planctomycetota bacterium]|jgi:hypothetical protein